MPEDTDNDSSEFEDLYSVVNRRLHLKPSHVQDLRKKNLKLKVKSYSHDGIDNPLFLRLEPYRKHQEKGTSNTMIPKEKAAISAHTRCDQYTQDVARSSGAMSSRNRINISGLQDLDSKHQNKALNQSSSSRGLEIHDESKNIGYRGSSEEKYSSKLNGQRNQYTYQNMGGIKRAMALEAPFDGIEKANQHFPTKKPSITLQNVEKKNSVFSKKRYTFNGVDQKCGPNISTEYCPPRPDVRINVKKEYGNIL
jgi:hypothetical protein